MNSSFSDSDLAFCRVKIAQDVLRRIQEKSFEAIAEYYLLIPDLEYKYYNPAPGRLTINQGDGDRESLRQEFMSCRCRGTALGAILISTVSLFDNFDLPFEFSFITRRECYSRLEEWFSRSNLNWIESAFSDLELDLEKHNFEEFHRRHNSLEERLKLIMENIIKNGGDFVPEQLPGVSLPSGEPFDL